MLCSRRGRDFERYERSTLTTNMNEHDGELVRYINLKLAALGQPTSQLTADPYFQDIAGPLLRNYYRKGELLGEPPAS
jgi:hypothetical protein